MFLNALILIPLGFPMVYKATFSSGWKKLWEEEMEQFESIKNVEEQR